MQADVLIIGGGHAGCEAAWAAANAGLHTTLITPDLGKLADLAWLPHVGGYIRADLLREIDQLDGLHARIADQTALRLHYVRRSLRAAIDRRNPPQATPL